jgi:hypothetical protein
MQFRIDRDIPCCELVLRFNAISCTHGVTIQMPLILVMIHQSTYDVLALCQCVDHYYYPHARARILDWQRLIILPCLPESTHHLQLSQSNCQGLEYPLCPPFHLRDQV